MPYVVTTRAGGPAQQDRVEAAERVEARRAAVGARVRRGEEAVELRGDERGVPPLGGRGAADERRESGGGEGLVRRCDREAPPGRVRAGDDLHARHVRRGEREEPVARAAESLER
ncbi:MAG: hypothetical protein ACTHNI_02080, partial [Cellulosimicrobium cellulans]